MGKGINKVILVGNLGQAPEIKQLASGTTVANLSIATSESWKDKNTGELREKTEWHRIVLFAHLADIAAKYLGKGSKVYIEGKLQTRKWQDASGQDRYTTEITANQMQMLDSKGSGGGRTQVENAPTSNFDSNVVNKQAVNHGGYDNNKVEFMNTQDQGKSISPAVYDDFDDESFPF